MNNFTIVLKVIILFAGFSVIAMDRPKFVLKTFEMNGQSQVAFIENDRILVLPDTTKPQAQIIYLFEDKKPFDLSLPYRGALTRSFITTDSEKKRGLFSCRYSHDRWHDLVVYDSERGDATQRFSISLSDADREFYWQDCFDEIKPNSLIIQSSFYRFVWDCDYITGNHDLNESIGRLMWCYKKCTDYQYVFDKKTNIQSGAYATEHGFCVCPEFDTTKCESVMQKKNPYIQNYLWSSNRVFVVHYDKISSHDCPKQGKKFKKNGHVRTCKLDCGVCSIAHRPEKNSTNTDKSIRLENDGIGVMPCAMVIHKNNKVLVTMSAGERLIQYWRAADGKLIEQQQLHVPMPEFNNYHNEFMTMKKYLSFSRNGKLLAAAFYNQIKIAIVPFDVIYGVGAKEKIASNLLFLRNYEDGLLPDDVISLLIKKTMKVLKL